MKKCKLFSCLSIFVILLSLSACSLSNDEESRNEDESESLEYGNPSDLVNLANQLGNYTVDIRVDEYISSDLSNHDFQTGNYDEDALYDSLTYYGSAYDMTVCYTEEALLINRYLYGLLMYSTLFINCTAQNSSGLLVDAISEFTFDLLEGSGDYEYLGTFQYYWQYWYKSLFDATTYKLDQDSRYVLQDVGNDEDGNSYGLYMTNNGGTAYSLIDCLGSQMWYGMDNSAQDIGEMIWFNGLYYYEDLNQMDVYASTGYFVYTDYSYNNVALIVDDFSFSVYDVGKTNIDDIVDECMSSIGY